MKRTIGVLIVAVLMFCLLMGCQSSGKNSLSAKDEMKIKEDYLALIGPNKLTGEEFDPKDFSIRVIWRSGDVYALYIDSNRAGYTQAERIVAIEGVKFWFPNGQRLRVYSDGCFYTLEEGYEEGLLTKEDLKSMQKDYAYVNLSPESGFWDPTFDRDAFIEDALSFE